MLKVAHYADLHASNTNKAEAIKQLGFILRTAEERHVDLIVNAGDTFDGAITLSDNSPVNEILDLLRGCRIPQYIIEGTKSHDVPGSIDIFGRLGDHIRVFRTPETISICLPVDENFDVRKDVTLSFLPAPTKSFLAVDYKGSQEETNAELAIKLRELLAGFGAAAAGHLGPHVMVAHITVAGAEASTGQPVGGDMQISKVDIDSLARPDYCALGHIHKSQQDSLHRHIRYAGSPYAINFGELEEKSFTIVTFDDQGHLADLDIIPTPTRPRQVIDADIVDGKLVLLGTPHPGADVKLRISGPEHQFHDGIDAEAAALCADAASLKIDKVKMPMVRPRSSGFLTGQTLREEVKIYAESHKLPVTEGILAKADQMEEEAAREA